MNIMLNKRFKEWIRSIDRRSIDRRSTDRNGQQTVGHTVNRPSKPTVNRPPTKDNKETFKEKRTPPSAAPDKKPPTEFQEQQDSIIDYFGRYFGTECSHGMAGSILNWSGDIGDALVAITLCEGFVKNGGEPMAGIRQKLRDRPWNDAQQAEAKALTKRFRDSMGQKYGNQIGAILGKLKT